MKSVSRNRCAVFLVTLLLTQLLPIIAVAAETSFKQCTIPALHMNISVPDEYLVITRDTIETDPVWNALGITWDDGQKLLGDYIYLTAVAPSREFEITVSRTNTNSGVTNLSDLSNSQIKELVDGVKSHYGEYGVTVNSTSLVEQSNTKFMRIEGWLQREAAYDHEIEYSTVRNRNSINITTHLYSRSSSINEDDQKALDTLAQEVLRSVSFTDITISSPKNESESWFDKAISKMLGAGILGLIFGGFSIFRHNSKKDKNVESGNSPLNGQESASESDDQKNSDDALPIEKTENKIPVCTSGGETNSGSINQQRIHEGDCPPDDDQMAEDTMQLPKDVPPDPKAKPKQQTASQSTETTKNAENGVQYPVVSFCRKCGSKLIPGSKYCNKCGAKVYEISS